MRNQAKQALKVQPNKEQMMLNVSYSASPYFLQMWGDNIFRTEAENRSQVVEDFVYYAELISKFRGYLHSLSLGTELETFTTGEISDLADAYADLTLFIVERSVREQVQWLVEELSNFKPAEQC